MKIIAEDLQFPEGPVALADGSVVLVEMASGLLTRAWDEEGRKEVVADLGGGPNGAAVGPDGRIYVVNNGGYKFVPRAGELRPAGSLPEPGWVEAVDLETGRVERLYNRCGDETFGHPNDLIFDTHGGFYFTDSGKLTQAGIEWGAVYYAKADGSAIERVTGPLLSPNGIGLSPDGETLYVTETVTASLWSWDVLGPGKVRMMNPDAVPHGGRFVVGSADFERFDSLAVTASGRVIVGTLINGGLTEICPDSGARQHYPMSDGGVTNVAFGGPDLRTAYVTMAGTGRLGALDWHEPGLALAHGS